MLLVESREEDEMVLPGGKSMENEPPHMAAPRAVGNLTALDVVPRRLLLIDFYPASVYGNEWETINYVFYCGLVDFNAPSVTDLGIGHRWIERTKITHHAYRDQFHRIRKSLMVLDEGRTTQYLVHSNAVEVRVDGAARAIS
ncbi:hypothetical protein AT728_37660 [Streptomyces silvensis]|uniref:Uncharacterized protein n=1 Tax=Streptomyces silvensis TaxID=1765722 RepID=A0A0W7WRC5_9ACTN|nr:hypothetical protein AT728_37660 [Streptomyces silvensis]